MPNLVTLGQKLRVNNVEPIAGSLSHSNRDESNWPNLKCVYLNVHSNIPKSIWQRLLSTCVGLEYLDMTPANEMNDEEIYEVKFFNNKSIVNAV